MGLLASCATHQQPKDSVTLLGLAPYGTTNLVAATEMKEMVQEFLACFPDWDKPVTNGVRSELPFPYIFRVQFHLTHTDLSIPVYHKDPRIFPGLWRHPSGVHIYFEPEKSRRFLELVDMMSPSASKLVHRTGASRKADGPPLSPTERGYSQQRPLQAASF